MVAHRVCAGGYPEVHQLAERDRAGWFRDYVRTTIERDVVELSGIRKVAPMHQLLRLLAAPVVIDGLPLQGRVVDEALHNQRCGLETIHLVTTLPAWSRNLTRRVKKRPKVFLTDPGLAAWLLGKTPTALEDPTDPATGQLVETFVIAELRRQLTWASTDIGMFHWQDRSGGEVDGGDRAKAKRMRDALLPDSRVRYVIDNAIGYYPAHRGGGTFSSTGHEDHLHVSFMPGSTFDVRPYFGAKPLPPIKWPLRLEDHNLGVMFLEIALVHCDFGDIVVDGSLGTRTLEATQQMQGFLGRRVRPAKVTRGDVEAITGWSKMEPKTRADYIMTIGDQGPRVHELRANLRKIGQNVDPSGAYDLKVQEAMRNVQRFWNATDKAGNASQGDRQLVRALAE